MAITFKLTCINEGGSSEISNIYIRTMDCAVNDITTFAPSGGITQDFGGVGSLGYEIVEKNPPGFGGTECVDMLSDCVFMQGLS